MHIAHCTVLKYSVQLMLELVLIFFTINALIVVKTMFLDMIIYIKQQFAKLIKWGKSNKLTLKIEIIFTTT